MANSTEEINEQFGQLIDKLENYSCGLSLPLPYNMHVEQLRKALPEMVAEFKKVYVEITKENLWK